VEDEILQDRINTMKDEVDMQSDEIIIKEIRNILEAITIENALIISNGDNSDYVSGQSEYAIIIGGVKVSRGFTYEHLLTELILNAPNSKCISFDTLLQRAR
jgi:hypothetical protein